MIYDGIYKRYCEKGKFADSVFEEMFTEFRTDPDRLEGDFHELDILLVKYLYTVMPPEIVREINERNDRLWEEWQLELNGKKIMLMCFKYRKIYNYQRQATSILDIHNLVYYGDAHMDSWLRAVKDIIYHSHDCAAFKIDSTEKGQDNMRFFRDKVYKLMKQSNKMKRWIVDYEKALPTNDPQVNTLEWLLSAMQKQIDLDLHFSNGDYNYSRLEALDPRTKEEKKKAKGKGKGKEKTKDAAPSTVEEEEEVKSPKKTKQQKGKSKGKGEDPPPAAPAEPEAKAKAKAKAKAEAKQKASKAVNANKGTERSRNLPPILLTHKTENGKEVLHNLQNECGYLAHSGVGKCEALEDHNCNFSHNYNLSKANKKKVPKPPGLDAYLKRIKNGERAYTPRGERSASRTSNNSNGSGKEEKKKKKGKGNGKGRLQSNGGKKQYGIYYNKVCEEKNWCVDYCFGNCTKTEGTKGHDNLHHVEHEVVKKEVEKRRAAAKADGVKPDGSK